MTPLIIAGFASAAALLIVALLVIGYQFIATFGDPDPYRGDFWDGFPGGES